MGFMDDVLGTLIGTPVKFIADGANTVISSTVGAVVHQTVMSGLDPSKITNAIPGVLSGAANVGEKLVNGAANTGEKLVNGIVNKTEDIVNGAANTGEKLVNGAAGFATNAANGLGDFLKSPILLIGIGILAIVVVSKTLDNKQNK